MPAATRRLHRATIGQVVMESRSTHSAPPTARPTTYPVATVRCRPRLVSRPSGSAVSSVQRNAGSNVRPRRRAIAARSSVESSSRALATSASARQVTPPAIAPASTIGPSRSWRRRTPSATPAAAHSTTRITPTICVAVGPLASTTRRRRRARSRSQRAPPEGTTPASARTCRWQRSPHLAWPATKRARRGWR